MDIAGYSTRKKHSDRVNDEEYDTNRSGGAITTNGQYDVTKHIGKY